MNTIQTDVLVVGGGGAAKNTKGKKAPDLRPETIRKALDETNRFSSMQGSEKPGNVTKDLKTLAWDNILVHINENTLDTALEVIRDIRDNRLNNMKVENTDDLIDALELNNLVQVGEVLALATRMRKESRGDLYREGFRERDDANWLKVITIDNKNGEIALGTEVIDPDWSDREGDMGDYRWG